MKLRDLCWIRKDREEYFAAGITIACVIGGIVSSYWHFADRVNVRGDIKINRELSRESEFRQLKETYFTPKLKVGATTYYKMERPPELKLPPPSDEEGQ